MRRILVAPDNHVKTIDLEQLRVDHASAMFDGLSDSRGYVFLPANPPVNVEALASFYKSLMAGGPLDRTETWLNWVVKKTGTDIPVGYTQATIRDQLVYVGYYIFPAHWRQGFATAALQATICKLLETYSMNKVHAFVDTRNVASIALLEKLNFTCVRTITEADYFKGSSSDEHDFVLIS